MVILATRSGVVVAKPRLRCSRQRSPARQRGPQPRRAFFFREIAGECAGRGRRAGRVCDASLPFLAASVLLDRGRGCAFNFVGSHMAHFAASPRTASKLHREALPTGLERESLVVHNFDDRAARMGPRRRAACDPTPRATARFRAGRFLWHRARPAQVPTRDASSSMSSSPPPLWANAAAAPVAPALADATGATDFCRMPFQSGVHGTGRRIHAPGAASASPPPRHASRRHSRCTRPRRAPALRASWLSRSASRRSSARPTPFAPSPPAHRMAFVREGRERETTSKHADREPGERLEGSNFRPPTSTGQMLPATYSG